MEQAHIGIVMGSDSDLPVMKAAVQLLDDFQVPYEISIISAHRTPAAAERYAAQAESRGLAVIIAAAGGAAHLAGVMAAWTILPVIGVPIQSNLLGGLDSLLAMVQMPAGVPVATVGINGAQNAALLAVQILAANNGDLRQRLHQWKADQAERVNTRSAQLAEWGVQTYLERMKQ